MRRRGRRPRLQPMLPLLLVLRLPVLVPVLVLPQELLLLTRLLLALSLSSAQVFRRTLRTWRVLASLHHSPSFRVRARRSHTRHKSAQTRETARWAPRGWAPGLAFLQSPFSLSPSHTESVYSLVSVSQFSLLEF
jgi:hypothetical protein